MKYFRNIYQVVYFFVFWWAKKITKQLKPYKQRSWGKRRRRKRRRGGKRGRKRGRRWWGRIIVQKLKFEESLHVKKLKKKKKDQWSETNSKWWKLDNLRCTKSITTCFFHSSERSKDWPNLPHWKPPASFATSKRNCKPHTDYYKGMQQLG